MGSLRHLEMECPPGPPPLGEWAELSRLRDRPHLRPPAPLPGLGMSPLGRPAGALQVCVHSCVSRVPKSLH